MVATYTFALFWFIRGLFVSTAYTLNIKYIFFLYTDI